MTDYNPELPSVWEEYVVHIPLPEHFGAAQMEHRAQMLSRVRYLLVVGSLLRPRRIVEYACRELGFASRGSYFDILKDHAVADREFNIELLSLADDCDVAIASHGIGGAGAEIVIRELCALVHLIADRQGKPLERAIRAVGRSGTRGTLAPLEYGTVGISSLSYDDQMNAAAPDPLLLSLLVDAAKKTGEPYALGKGISTAFFWSGQGRSTPSERPESSALKQRRQQRNQDLLWSWLEAGIDFVEMEDYAVHAVCGSMAIPSVSAGVIVARRFDAQTQRFVLDYDKASKERTELRPAAAILRAFDAHRQLST
ncbi:MAG: hypothetical protein RBU37_14840 [Myxococcota bacterium]|jgi:uridine phosphorylase|nr:hypothetical protein [Myxococcota bacterium]